MKYDQSISSFKSSVEIAELNYTDTHNIIKFRERLNIALKQLKENILFDLVEGNKIKISELNQLTHNHKFGSIHKNNVLDLFDYLDSLEKNCTNKELNVSFLSPNMLVAYHKQCTIGVLELLYNEVGYVDIRYALCNNYYISKYENNITIGDNNLSYPPITVDIEKTIHKVDRINL